MECETLFEEKNIMIDKLVLTYKKDKFKARVTYFNDPYSFSRKQIVLYSHKKTVIILLNIIKNMA